MPKSSGIIKILLIVLAGVVFSFILVYVMPKVLAIKYDANETSNVLAKTPKEDTKVLSKVEVKKDEIKHIKTPEPLKAIYMTACVVGTTNLRDGLVKLVDETEINAIVIDVKDYSGTLSFKPQNPDLDHAWQASKCGSRDMKEFLQTLKEKNIYTIARVTVFQDPHFSKLHPELSVQSASMGTPWKDRKGLNFLDVGGKGTWEYIRAITQEVYDIGFDEINYDYIRYPSDGNMKDAVYKLSVGTKPDQLEKFFSYLREESKKIGIVTSADLFGMTTTNTDDLNIGQVLEKAMPYFDYIAPMVYPSHWPNGWNGFKNPNDHVYEVVKISMGEAVKRAKATESKINILGSEDVYKDEFSKTSSSTVKVKTGLFTKNSYPATNLRTWIQDFDYGGNYDVSEIKAQIKASNDVGVTSWMIWSPSNRYTRGALVSE